MSSSPSLTRWSSQAPRKTRRRIQCTRLRLAGPTSSVQCSLMCSPRGEVGSRISPLTASSSRSWSSSRLEPVVDEVELHRGLLDPLGEVLLVEGEAELAVLEHVVGARLVIASASCLLHKFFRSAGPRLGSDHPAGPPRDDHLCRSARAVRIDRPRRLKEGLQLGVERDLFSDLEPRVLEVELALDPAQDVVVDLAAVAQSRSAVARWASISSRTRRW